MLPPGGRLAAITSSHCVPGDAAWVHAFASLDDARVVFTMAIDGRAYARRGTGFDTRLTVLDRSGEPAIRMDGRAKAADAAALLDAGHRERAAALGRHTRAGRRPLRSHAGTASRDLADDAQARRRARAEGGPRLGPGRRARHRDRPRRRARGHVRRSLRALAPERRPGAGRHPSIRPRWCSRARWPRCPIRCRPGARCCPNASSPTGCSPTRKRRASSSRARPMRATSVPATASARAGRPFSAAGPTTAKPSTPLISPTTARPFRRRSGSAAAGCSATGPAPARAARSPPSCSTTGSGAASARSGSPSPTSSSRTRAATGPRIGRARRRRHRTWPSSARGPRSRCPRGSSSRPTRRCARRPARGRRRGSTRSSPGSRARSTRTTATLIKGASCSTRPTRWRTRRARRAAAARSPPRSRGARDFASRTRSPMRASPTSRRPAPPPCPVSPTPEAPRACGPPARRRSRSAPTSSPRWRRAAWRRWRWSRGT